MLRTVLAKGVLERFIELYSFKFKSVRKPHGESGLPWWHLSVSAVMRGPTCNFEKCHLQRVGVQTMMTSVGNCSFEMMVQWRHEIHHKLGFSGFTVFGQELEASLLGDSILNSKVENSEDVLYAAQYCKNSEMSVDFGINKLCKLCRVSMRGFGLVSTFAVGLWTAKVKESKCDAWKRDVTLWRCKNWIVNRWGQLGAGIRIVSQVLEFQGRVCRE